MWKPHSNHTAFAAVAGKSLLLITLLLPAALALAGPPSNAALPIQPIRVVTEDFPPYNYEKDGKIQGVSTEVVKAVLDHLGLDAEIKIYPWMRAYKLVVQNPNVLIYTISKNQRRERLFKWVGQIAPGKNFLYSKSTRNDIVINSLEDLKHYRIGTVRGSVRSQYLLHHGFEAETNVFRVNNDDQNFKKLMKGRLDLWAANELNIHYILTHRYKVDPAIVKKSFQLDIQTDMQMAFGHKTNDALVARFQRALQEIKANGVFDRIHRKHFPNLDGNNNTL